MAGFKYLVLAAAVAGLVAAKKKAAAAFPEEDGVLVLDESNFDAAIAAHDPLLVEFYAPWCGHCKKLAPEYAKAAKALAGEGIKLAKVDAAEHKSLGEKFGVQGFPTLKWFKGGKPTDYNGGREEAGIVAWIRKRTGSATTALATAADATAFAAKAEVSIIAFVTADSALAKAVAEAANANDDIPFAVTSADAVRAAYNVPAGTEAVVLVNTFEGEDNQLTYAGATEAAAINEWASSHSLPAVVTFTQESAPKIFRGTVKTHFLLFADTEEAASVAALTAFRASALANRGSALYVRVPPTEERVVSYFGIAAADMPTAVLVTMPEGGSMKKFGWKAGAPLTTEAFNQHVADFKAGALKPTLKSEPVPDAATNEAADVTVVVGENFADVVLAADKDVLLEVYAPWCGHCKSLAPIYEKLGAAVKSSAAAGSLVIAKMDGTANEVDYPGVNVKGFPTLLFFPATKGGDKKVVEYDGARDLEGFMAYLGKNAVKGDALAKVAVDEDETGNDEEL